ncbi:hypothetical protein LWI29_006688 [Acer saccharum]|uniref:Uncharacterized protein n=1 Tax=Acer saccharum TaxID=4024 RepID=A0AA39UZU4_ACESA|nr:hypothetical protein LWI29_006688 [Acer saccharum]
MSSRSEDSSNPSLEKVIDDYRGDSSEIDLNLSDSSSDLSHHDGVYGQRPEGEKNFSERPCCHCRHHRTATVATAFERPVIASAAEEPIRTGSDDRAAFVASTITPFLVELHLTDGDATIVSVGRFAAEIG